MIKHKNIFGVDISKDFFDVVDSYGTHNQFTNDERGFDAFILILSKRSLVVMEATGAYHFRLAQYLVSKKIKTSVVNPLSVKRFRQMKLSKIKTDKVDARMICDYAKINPVPLYKGISKRHKQCQQLISLADLYQRQITALKNKLKGEAALGLPSPMVIFSIKRQLKALESEIDLIEKDLNVYIKKAHPTQQDLLEGIPGIGNKTARYMILLTEGFRRFDNSRQLCSFAGLTPSIRQSGTSIRGKSRITKMGNGKLRNLLFLCSFSACKYNYFCRDLYERIVAKGKSKKLALIAVCNKLIKQAFAIVNSGKPYSNEYKRKIKISANVNSTLTLV